MAQANPNWGRWIFATMTDRFKTEFQGLKTQLYVEGEHRELPTDRALLEFRMDGPQIKQLSKKTFRLEVTINILVQTMVDQDAHANRRWLGEVAEWLGQDHCVYRYGDGPQDDDSLLGTLRYQSRKRTEGTKLHYFGLIDDSLNSEKSSAEADFVMTLTN